VGSTTEKCFILAVLPPIILPLLDILVLLDIEPRNLVRNLPNTSSAFFDFRLRIGYFLSDFREGSLDCGEFGACASKSGCLGSLVRVHRGNFFVKELIAFGFGAIVCSTTLFRVEGLETSIGLVELALLCGLLLFGGFPLGKEGCMFGFFGFDLRF